jgi:putative phosphoesterase
MRIGILSDTHDNIEAVEWIVKEFNARQVDFIIHAGDYCAPFSLRPFSKLTCDWLGVLGNNDGETEGLATVSEGRIKPGNAVFERGNKRILVDHINPLRDALAKSGQFDLLVFGHTHIPEVYRLGKCLCVNPGEVCGYLTGNRTAVCLNLDELEPDRVEIISMK